MADSFKVIKIRSWTHFNEVLESYESLGDDLPYWSFRGQSNSGWTLKPSLTRTLEECGIKNPNKALSIERILARYFYSNNKHFVEFTHSNIDDRDVFYLWSLMQHYGSPTRLLDWTDSPQVALYHCVESNWGVDGAVFVIQNERVETKSKELFGRISYEDFKSWNIQDAISPVIATVNTARSYYQQGCYTVSKNPLADHETLITNLNLDDNCFFKLIIPKELKPIILKKLRSSNIKADILFPDAFGLGKEISNLARIVSTRFIKK